MFHVIGVFVTRSFHGVHRDANSVSLKAEEFDIMNMHLSLVLLNIHPIHIMHF